MVTQETARNDVDAGHVTLSKGKSEDVISTRSTWLSTEVLQKVQ